MLQRLFVPHFRMHFFVIILFILSQNFYLNSSLASENKKVNSAYRISLAAPIISAYSGTTLSGSSVANAAIKIYETNAAKTTAVRLLGSVVSNSSGNWSFDFTQAIGGAPALGTGIMATATDNLSITSPYSYAFSITGTTTSLFGNIQYTCKPDKILLGVNNLVDKIIGYYPFNGNATDASGNGNDGVVTGAVLTEDRFGNQNGAYQFNGTDYISTNINSLAGSALTISYWFKGSKIGSAVSQSSSFPSGNITSCIYDINGSPRHIVSYDNGISGALSAGTNIEDGNWHHIVLTWRRNYTNGFKTYLDGNLVAQRNTFPGSIPNLNVNVVFGFGTNGNNTIGVLDDIAIYSRSLGEEEVKTLFSNFSWQGPEDIYTSSAGTQMGALVIGTVSETANYYAKGPCRNGSAVNYKIPVKLSTNGCNMPFNGIVHSLPGKIEIENYNLGGKGIGYMDFTNGNAGQMYRTDDVDIEQCLDQGGGYNVSSIAAGEWLNYTVKIKHPGLYTFKARVASANDGTSFNFLVKGQYLRGSITVPNTGGLQIWQTLTIPDLYLDAGIQVLTLQINSTGFNLNYIDVFELENEPFESGWQIPCVIEAEKYDKGARNVAYNDKSSGNSFGLFRTEDVDIETCTDIGGGYNITSIEKDEWLEYTVNVPSTGKYTFKPRVASLYSNKKMHFEIDGVDITDSITIPNTGGWQIWQTVEINDIDLTEGLQVIRVSFETDRINLNYFEILEDEEISLSVFKINTTKLRALSFQLLGAGLEATFTSPSVITPVLTQVPETGVATVKLHFEDNSSMIPMEVYFGIDRFNIISNLQYSIDGGLTKIIMPAENYNVNGSELHLLTSEVINEKTELYPLLLQGKYLKLSDTQHSIFKVNGLDHLLGEVPISLSITNEKDENMAVTSSFTWSPEPLTPEGIYKYKLMVNQKFFEGFFVLVK